MWRVNLAPECDTAGAKIWAPRRDNADAMI
jgi:hypothetical protein